MGVFPIATHRLSPLALWRDPARGFVLRAGLVTLGAALLLGAPLALGGRVLSGGDIVNQYLPYKHLIRSVMAQGRFPHWDTAIFAGRPLQGDIQTGLLYPLNVFYWLLPLPLAFTVAALAHYWLAGWGMALWTRRWMRGEAGPLLAGVLYMLAGRLTAVLLDGVVLLPEAAAWLPWLLWAWRRLAESLDEELDRAPWDFAAVTAFLALAVLTGAPQIAFYSIAALGVYALVLAWGAAPGAAGDKMARSAVGEAAERPLLPLRVKPLLLLAASGLLAVGLCAGQLLPTRMFIGQSWDRAHGASWEYVTDGSLEPRMALTAVAPRFFGHPRDEQFYWGESGYHEVSNYCTAAGPFLALLLFALAVIRRRRGGAAGDRRHAVFLVLLLGAAAVLAPGRHSPVFWLAYHLVPGFDRFRVPARLMLWVALAVAALAGRALDVLMAGAEEREAAGGRDALACIAWVTAVGAAVLALLAAVAPSFASALGMSQLHMPAGQTVAEWTRRIEALQSVARREVLEFAAQWLAVGALAAGIAAAPASARRRRAALAAILVAGCAVRLAWHGWLFTSSAPPMAFERRAFVPAETAALARLSNPVAAPFYPRTERVDLLERELAQGGRFLWLDSVLDWHYDQNQPELLTDRPIVYGLAQMRGYDPVNSRRFGLFMNALAGLPSETNPRGFMLVPDGDLKAVRWPLVQAWDCRVVLTYSATQAPEALEEIGRWTFPADAGTGPQVLRALRFREPWGPARLCRPLVPPSGMAPEAIANWMTRSDFDIRTMAIVEGGDPLAALKGIAWSDRASAGAPPQKEPVLASPAGPGHWQCRVNAQEPSLLVVAESYYPGWQARVDGVRLPVVPANLAQCGIPVPAGLHDVDLAFCPREWTQGILVSAISLALVALVVVRWRRRLLNG